MKSLYALRVKKVGKYPPEIKCPWQAGAFIGTTHNTYAGLTIRNVFTPNEISFFVHREDAQRFLNQHKDNYPIVLEIVEWKQA
jgi:hypothetical protein